MASTRVCLCVADHMYLILICRAIVPFDRYEILM